MGVGVAAAALLVIACTTDYQKGVEDPRYGGPNALAGEKQPGPSSEYLAEEGAIGAGINAGTPECVKAGGALIDAGTCAVSFSKDVLTTFAAANCQAAGCHGGASPQNQPPIDPADATKTWNGFAAFTLTNGKAYINPCSLDPAVSTIACNVSSAAPCGSVMPPGIGLPADVVTKIETWVKCGAPNN